MLLNEEIDFYGKEFVEGGLNHHGIDLEEYIARRKALSLEALLKSLHRERVINPSPEVRRKNEQFRAAKRGLQATTLKVRKRK